MRVDDIKKVKPSKDNVVTRKLEQEKEGGLFFATTIKDVKNTELSYAEVLAVGPTATRPDICPGLEVGNSVVYNSFAGSHIATNELKELYKVMSGYSIMAILDDINNLNESTIHPTCNRLLLAEKFVDETNSGIFISAADAKDPRLEDLDYGTVIKIGPSCKLGYKVGDIVAYNPYAGERIRQAESVDKPALRVLIEEDALLSI